MPVPPTSLVGAYRISYDIPFSTVSVTEGPGKAGCPCGIRRLVFAIEPKGGQTKPPQERLHGKPIDLTESGFSGFAAYASCRPSRTIARKRYQPSIGLLRP